MALDEYLKLASFVLLAIAGGSVVAHVVGWSDLQRAQERLMNKGIPVDQAGRKAKHQRRVLQHCLAFSYVIGSLLLVAGTAVGFIQEDRVQDSVSAASLIWLATYDCFDPPREWTTFIGRTGASRFWYVEIRQPGQHSPEDIPSDVWTVNADSGAIEPWNSLARDIAGQSCFRNP